VGLMNYFRKKSPWLLHYNTGSCNGCDIEVTAAVTPVHDVERFGIVPKGSPRHADILAITGPVTKQSQKRLIRLYEQTPDPKVVVAIGNCPTSNCVFGGCYNVVGPLDRLIPVDVFVPGCPPRPQAIIDGIIKGIARLER
jgi:Ni,Fe-hydrogenase III small subunit